jgi:fermentation-respiration switch protein FrsA (DUF1100 family)
MSDSQTSTRPSLQRRVFRQLRNIAIGYLLIVLMLAFFQRKLIYVPSRESNLGSACLGPVAHRVVDVVATTADGIDLNGWHWRAGSVDADQIADGRLVVLFFHGNGGHRLHRYDECDLLNDLGADTVIFDYRGYGDNAGTPTEEGLSHDARAGWEFLTDRRGVDPGCIVLLGESLGGGVAVRLASELCEQGTSPGGLILRSTFSTLSDAASYHYPWLPVRTVLVDRYPSAEQIGQVDCPLLFVHGDEDSIIPIDLGQKLFRAAPSVSANGVPKRFVKLGGANHNNVLHIAGPQVHKVTGEFFESIR